MRDIVKDEGEPERREAPNPLQSIDTFDSIHNSLLETVRTVTRKPSMVGILNLQERVKSATYTASTIAYYNFFRETEDDGIIEAALSAMMTAIEQATALLKEIYPQFEGEDEYGPEIRQALMEVFTDSFDEEAAIEQAAHILKSYATMAKNLQVATLGSLKVHDYVEKTMKNNNRRQAALRFGSTATASFVGFILAHKFQARKKA